MSKLIKTDNEYKEWIGELKQRIRQSQIKAAVKVNTELLKLYWSIGGDIVLLKAEAKWGDGIIEQLSQDLKTNFPDMSGFSSRNLWYMKKWYSFYSQPDTKLPQVGAESKSEKLPQDNPTIGLLICKSKNNIVARYTLDTANLPIGISEYELSQLYPKDFKSTLPSIEEIENELKD